jgi:eukaryotic-like serine/threonine-protein kinase
MIRFLRLLAQLLVLVIVALASALISMRLAIHGRIVTVPDLRGMAPAAAERAVLERGLELTRSDHFYSATVPAGRIVSQQPEPGSRVRTGWRVQAAESLGPQLIEIPSLLGMSPRAAEIDIRRRGLEVGSSGELPTETAAPQAVLAQTPAAGAQGVASPRISLLYAAPTPEPAYAMPDLTGLTLAEASALAAASGLKIGSISSSAPTLASPAGAGNQAMLAKPNPSLSTVVGQTPSPGSRVSAAISLSLQVAQPQ